MDYSELTRSLEDILDFTVPCGLTLSVNTSYSSRFNRSWVLGVRNGIQPNVAYTYSWGEQAQPARESSGPQTEREVNMRTVTRPRRFLSEDQSQFFTQTHEKSPAQSPQQSPSTGRKGATDTGTGTSTDTGTGATGTNMGAGVGGSIQVGGGPRTVGNQGYEVTNMDVLHTQYTHSRSADSHAHTADGLKRLSAAQLLSEPEHPPQTRSGATSTPQHLTHRLGRHGTPQDTSAHSSPHAQDEGHPQATGGHTSCGHTHSYLPARDKVKHRCIVSGILYDDMGVEGNAEMLLGPRTRMTLSAYSSYPPYNARATNSHNTPATTHQSPAAAEAAESQLIAFARHTSANGLFTTTGLFMSGGMVFGTSLLVKPPRQSLLGRVQVGGEIVYSIEGENVPGISIGAHFKEKEEAHQWLTTVSPISGHCTVGFSSEFTRQLTLASRYELNVYSKDSSIAFGCDAHVDGPFRLRFCCDTEQGASIAVEYTTPTMAISVGGGAGISRLYLQTMGLSFTVSS